MTESPREALSRAAANSFLGPDRPETHVHVRRDDWEALGRAVDASRERLEALHHSPRCPAKWRCRLPLKGSRGDSHMSYATADDRTADVAAHFEVYSGTGEQLLALAIPGLRDVVVDVMLNDGPDDSVYDIADRIVAQSAAGTWPVDTEALKDALMQPGVWDRYLRGAHSIDADLNAGLLAEAVAATLRGTPMTQQELAEHHHAALSSYLNRDAAD